MSWDAAMRDEQALERIRTDHAGIQGRHETIAVDRIKNRYGTVSYAQGHRRGFWDGVMWVLSQQLRIDDLTVAELAAELEKGTGSIYWPVKDADPRFWAVCDRCRTNQLFDSRGVCDACGWDAKDTP